MGRIKIAKVFSVLSLVVFSGLFALGSWIFWDLPSVSALESSLSVPSIRITDHAGRLLYELIDDQGGKNAPLPLASIPPALQQATIATEDQNFYNHPGVDLTGILRAFWINLRGGETLAGGSTITQQVARNLLLSEEERFERTLRRKLRESVLAWRITQKYARDEILALYLNQMYYGGMAYGVEAAAQTYFSRPAVQLSLAECALIAGIPQSPALYNPLVNPEAAIERQKIVLGLMRSQGFIPQEAFDLASRQPLLFSSSPYPVEAPHFVMLVSAEIDRILPEQDRAGFGALTVRTTLDLDLQRRAENAVTRHLQALGDPSPAILSGGAGTSHAVPGGHNVNNAALVALQPETGAILSMVGSPDYFDPDQAGALNMAVSPRQPGSALKPLIYAAAFSPERAAPLTPATMLLDVKTSFVTAENQAYIPANFDNLEHGPVSARQALASSLNIPAVIVLDQIGLDDFFDLANRLGISTFGDPAAYDLSLALGGGEVTLLELTAAYGAFANLGRRAVPFAILDISTLEGEVIYRQPQSAAPQVLDERVAWLISDILNDNDARSLGFGLNSALRIGRPASVKTGTTTNFHDNWTVGYTPDLVAGVWVGNASHEPMRGVTGLSGAGPIWHQFMREALSGTPPSRFERPEGLVKVRVCSPSGLLPTHDCPYTRQEWFIQGTEPTSQDTLYHKIWIDIQTGRPADSQTLAEDRTAVTVLNLPPQAQPWARENGLLLLVDFTPGLAFTADDPDPLRIISPADQSRYLLNPTLAVEAQRIHIQVASVYSLVQVNLWLDGRLYATLHGPPFETWWTLEAGEHTLWAESQGENRQVFRSDTVHILVEAGLQPTP